MLDSLDSEDFISGIHNYCDRWCERCEFTNRCSVFAMEREFMDDNSSFDTDAMASKLESIFEDAKEMIVEKAEEFGLDETFELSDEEFREIKDRKNRFIDGQELAALSKAYGFEAKTVLDSKEEWLAFSSIDEVTREDVLAVLYWYQFFIGAKIHRGFHGILDDEGFEDADEIRDPQSGANGSIKIALIAVERSILSWTYLLAAQNADYIRPMIQTLDRIKRMAEAKFPRANDFVRPGFDELGPVM